MPDTSPPMDPTTDEADATQLRYAREQGEAYVRAVRHMLSNVAKGGEERSAGEYVVAYAIEDAEGIYEWGDGVLVWREPEQENLHLEVSVRDRSDNRLVPGLTVSAELTTAAGASVGRHTLPMLWHPMIYHFGFNWKVEPGVRHTLHVHIEPPRFRRHDDVNGKPLPGAGGRRVPGRQDLTRGRVA